MVVPRSFFTGRRRGAGCCFLERTCRTKVEDNFGLGVRKLYRWIRSVSRLRPQSRCKHRGCRRMGWTEPPGPAQAHVLNAPTRNPEPFWLVFRAPKASRIRDKKARIRCLDRLAE